MDKLNNLKKSKEMLWNKIQAVSVCTPNKFILFIHFGLFCYWHIHGKSKYYIIKMNKQYLKDPEELSSLFLKIWRSVIGTIPGSFKLPKTVWVFPEPLGPNAANIPLFPFMKSSNKGWTILSYTSFYKQQKKLVISDPISNSTKKKRNRYEILIEPGNNQPGKHEKTLRIPQSCFASALATIEAELMWLNKNR